MGRAGCPKPWKRGYVDALTANRHYRALLAKERRKGSTNAELLNQYVCPGCGLWHIGHSARREQEAS